MSQAIALLVMILAIGLFAAGSTLVARALPVVARAARRGARPWACDLCMSWWGALLGALAARILDVVGAREDAIAIALVAIVFIATGAVPVSMLLLRLIQQPSNALFELPPENDNDGDILR